MSGAGKAVLIQLLIGALAVTGFALWQDAIISALWGYGVGIANLLMLWVGFRLAERRAATAPRQGMTILYMSAVIRFILLAVFFVLGLAWLKLAPMPMVLTFVVMQLGSALSLQGKRRLTD